VLQIDFIVQMNFVVVVTKIKEAYSDISMMNVALIQSLSVNIVINLCLGRLHCKSIKLIVLLNITFLTLLLICMNNYYNLVQLAECLFGSTNV